MKMLKIFLSALSFAFLISAHACAFAAEKPKTQTFIGYPTFYSVNGLDLCMIADRDGTPKTHMPTYGLPENILACLKNAKTDKQVRITVATDNDNTIKPTACQIINGPRDCPNQKLGKKTVRGIYDGTDCGDYCYVLLKLQDGSAYSAFANTEEVEKLFGQKPGKQVILNVNIEQFWMSEGENPDGPGFCVIEDVFSGGKLVQAGK